MERMTNCIVDKCESIGHLTESGGRKLIRGLCKKHYQRFMKYGDVNFVKRIYNENRGNHELYGSYKTMLQRCRDTNCKDYKHYGGRGITVCDRWQGIHGFSNFLSDMGDRPKGLTLDRIDVNGSYSPDNCKWSTRQEQALNKRNSPTKGKA